MDDLLYPENDKNKKAPKPDATCWGCGVEQPQGKLFKQCPKCVENKFIPAKFCSNECFHASWKRHKAWHKEQQAVISQAVSFTRAPPPRELLVEAIAKLPEYDALMTQAKSHHVAVDIVGAKKILRKAVKLEPNRPEAYFQLASCFHTSGQLQDAAFYYELSIERWPLVALTGWSGGAEVEEKWALGNWRDAIDFVTDKHRRTECTDQPLPEWYKVDGLLKIILKTALKACDSENSPEMKARLSLLQACSITGMIRDGKLREEVSLVDLSSTELMEAASCFLFIVSTLQAGTDLDLGEAGIATMNEYIQMCTNVALEKMTEEISQMSASRESTLLYVPPVGSWVFFRSNKCNVLPDDIIEKAFGQVLGVPNCKGKVPVKVQGATSDYQVLISPVNLIEIPQDEQFHALVACMERETQWRYMTAVFESLNESRDS